MNVNENCPTCPARSTCCESIKFYAEDDGVTTMIVRTPVICPGPDQLTKIIDNKSTREFFGRVASPKVLTPVQGERLKLALGAPILTVIPKTSRILIVSAETDSPTVELTVIPMPRIKEK